VNGLTVFPAPSFFSRRVVLDRDLALEVTGLLAHVVGSASNTIRPSPASAMNRLPFARPDVSENVYRINTWTFGDGLQAV
jgi:hypothetical protein